MIGFIYKLTDNSNRVYYGSTIQPLNNRLWQHKDISNTCRSKIMDKDTMKLECLEQYYFDTDMDYKAHLIKRERYYIKNNKCINKKIPGRTMKEYEKDNMEKIKQTKKQYRFDNKEKIKENYEKNKEKYKEKFTCDCGSIIRKYDKSSHYKTKKHQRFIG